MAANDSRKIQVTVFTLLLLLLLQLTSCSYLEYQYLMLEDSRTALSHNFSAFLLTDRFDDWLMILESTRTPKGDGSRNEWTDDYSLGLGFIYVPDRLRTNLTEEEWSYEAIVGREKADTTSDRLVVSQVVITMPEHDSTFTIQIDSGRTEAMRQHVGKYNFEFHELTLPEEPGKIELTFNVSRISPAGVMKATKSYSIVLVKIRKRIYNYFGAQ